jgi:hypothetical protein
MSFACAAFRACSASICRWKTSTISAGVFLRERELLGVAEAGHGLRLPWLRAHLEGVHHGVS